MSGRMIDPNKPRISWRESTGMDKREPTALNEGFAKYLERTESTPEQRKAKAKRLADWADENLNPSQSANSG